MKTEIKLGGLGCCVLGLAAIPACQQVFAQSTYPSKSVRLVVPYPAGGTTDILARAISLELTGRWRQQVVVDNRGGANGNIGSGIVAKSPADGYTLLMGSIGPLTINPSLYRQMPFDTLKEFAPVTMIAQVPLVLVLHPTLPAKSLRELVALARSRPNQLTFASAGNGSTQHLAGELFKTQAGINITHVPYKGAGPAIVDLLGGHVVTMIDLIPSSLPHIRDRKLRALAVTTAKRSLALPDLPTFDESGFRGFDVSSWFGILVPHGTPDDVVAKLNTDIVATLTTPEMRQRMAGLGAELVGNSPSAFGADIRRDLAKWSKVVKDSNLRIDGI